MEPRMADNHYGWIVTKETLPDRSVEIHVIPNHEEDHLQRDCWCHPRVEEHDMRLVIHNEKN